MAPSQYIFLYTNILSLSMAKIFLYGIFFHAFSVNIIKLCKPSWNCPFQRFFRESIQKKQIIISKRINRGQR